MKKVILLLFSFLLFCTPVLAGDISLQKEFEMNILLESPMPSNVSKQQLLENDIAVYYDGGDSFYGVLLYLEEEYKPKNDLNYKYIRQALLSYKNVIITRKAYQLKPVIINDADYKFIDEEVRKTLAGYNYLANAVYY